MKPILLALASASLSLSILAGGGPQNVALVVNSDSWASLAVANEYILLRGIPPGNVIYLDHVPNFETIDVNVFRESILGPVLKTIEERHLTPQIDYVVYSADFPYAVETSPDIKGVKLPQVITTTASITGLTFLHERVMAKNIDYLRLNVNRAMRWVNIPKDKPFDEAEQKRYVEALGFMNGKETKFDAAAPILDELVKAHPKDFELQYNRACCLARLKKDDDAIAALTAAIDAGWFNPYHTREDEDLAGLRARPDFKALLLKLEKTFVATQPEHGFRSSYAWNEKCEIAPDGTGDHYLLSTMLAVTSGRGTSVNEALSYLRRAARADGTHPAGTIYYLVNGDVRSKTRRWAFPSAVEELTKLGVKAEIIEGNLPQKKADVMGAMAGIADFDWAASGSTILPGAICEHLTSCGGELAQFRGQTPCSAFLRAGAAGTSGAVQEPYAIQQKFPTPFIHVHYARGCSLAEAFFQSVSGPYQLIVLGDPLCAPWAKAPVVSLDGIKPHETVKGIVTLRPSAAAQPEVGLFKLYVDGMRYDDAQPESAIQFDTTRYGDGYHEIMLVGISKDPIETQGRIVVPVKFDNHGRSVKLIVQKKSANLNERFELTWELNGVDSIEVLCNGRTLFTSHAKRAALDGSEIGLGPATLRARGYLNANKAATTWSEPVSLTVEPAWLSAREKEAAATKKGFRVSFEDGPVTIAEPARDLQWLSKAGLTKGRTANVDGWFEVATDDLYQFQVKTPMIMWLEVDGERRDVQSGDRWNYLMFALKKGAHHLIFKVGAPLENAPLDIRFGASGTKSIEANMFLCVDIPQKN